LREGNVLLVKWAICLRVVAMRSQVSTPYTCMRA
jgi:hypothetical protein